MSRQGGSPLTLSGTPYARGRAHGVAMRDAIGKHLGAWMQSLAIARVGDPASYVAEFLAETDFLSAIGQRTPDLLEEVRGIADGADRPFALIFALQLLDEEWAYRASRFGGPAPDKCSSLAVVCGENLTWLAQNIDLGTYTEGSQALLRIDPANGPEALIFSLAGMIGLLGANAAGLGICVNALPQLASTSTGLPVAFIIRRILQCESLDDATDVLTTTPHATNQHYLIAAPGAARSFEASADGIIEYRPADPSRIFHTNHPLACVDPDIEGSSGNSEIRLQSLKRRLSNGVVGRAEIQAALSSFDDPRHPVCRLNRSDSGLTGFTTGSMIVALRRYRPGLAAWISIGPPSLSGYARVSVSAARDRPDSVIASTRT